MAYQGYGHQNDLKLIKNLLDFATGGLQPDLTFLLDVDPEVGLRRRQVGGDEWNRLDAYQLQYHERVRQGYLLMAAAEPSRWRVIDASQPFDMVQSKIQEALLSYLSNLS
jgi:dTMP kinase